MNSIHSLVLGTHNVKKAGELQGLLSPFGFELTTLADHPSAIEVVEDGSTFADNAALKASQQAKHLSHWVLGEDSGLCVDALKGAPGIYSARFSGENATDAANNERLLKELGETRIEKRTAHYVCHIALSDPNGNIRLTEEATCHGRIRSEPLGINGFGYDPLFEIIELHQTFGQLGPTFKSIISHRARALRRFIPMLIDLASEIDA